MTVSSRPLRSVVVIDDSEFDRHILKRQIFEANITEHVFEFDSGLKAVEFFSNYDQSKEKQPELFPPEVIFLDINMPLMTGFEFLEFFKKAILGNEELSSILLMMFTSSEIKEERKRALSYFFVKGCISKMPTTSETLKQQLQPFFPGL